MAKARYAAPPPNSASQKFSSVTVGALEQRLTPFLENRRARRRGEAAVNGKLARFDETDIAVLPKYWNQLSPGFRLLYTDATSLPVSSEHFNSPGGHYEIFYFATGPDSVDPTDTYGFDPSNWRLRVGHSNGVPDYIDETAFALDSSWSMEIDRFGFVPPGAFVTKDHQSDRYKVVVEQQDESFYGLTYLQGHPDGAHGFLSTMSLRNNWGADWASLGYDRNPASGTRVTCAPGTDGVGTGLLRHRAVLVKHEGSQGQVRDTVITSSLMSRCLEV